MKAFWLANSSLPSCSFGKSAREIFWFGNSSPDRCIFYSCGVSFLGYRYYKSYINLLNTDRLQELQQFCLQHPNILNVNRTIGGRDFEIELQAKSFDEFDSIMNEIRREFAGTIDDYEFVIPREEKKRSYFPFE